MATWTTKRDGIDRIRASHINDLQDGKVDKDLFAVFPEDYGAKGDGVTDDAAAIQAADTIGGDILFSDRTYLVDDDITIHAGTNLVFINGGELSITSGHTITINGNIIAGAHQIFDCAANNSVYGLRTAIPEWFGTNATPGTTDMTNAIQYAVSSLVPGGLFKLGPTDYVTSSTIIINRQINFAGEGWRSRIKPSATMTSGAYIAGVISGTTITLSENTISGTIGLGDTIIGGFVPPETTIVSLASGIADTAGAVYNISAAPTVTTPGTSVHFEIGGEDIIYVVPSGIMGVDNNSNRGYSFKDFAIGTEDAFPYARNGICLDLIAGYGVVATLIDRVKIRVLGRYSVYCSEATQVLIQNSELGSVAYNVAGDIVKTINNSIANSNPVVPALYINCYPGANLFVVEKNTFTHWGGKEYIYIEYAEGGLQIDHNYFEDVIDTVPVGGTKPAIRIQNGILPSISGNVFNIRAEVRSSVVSFDKVIAPSMSHNRFYTYAGGDVPIFTTTANTISLDFTPDNFIDDGSATMATRYQNSRIQFMETATPQPDCVVDASHHLTLTAAIAELTDAAFLAADTWWVQGAGIAHGTYLTGLISGAIGQVGSAYSLSTSPGALAARPVYIIHKKFIDFGVGTIGVWNLLTLPSSNVVTFGAVSGLPAYKKTDDDIVVFAGGASITTPSEGMNIAEPGSIRAGLRPNNYAVMPICGRVSGYLYVGGYLAMRATYEGNLTIHAVDADLSDAFLEGATLRHIHT